MKAEGTGALKAGPWRPWLCSEALISGGGAFALSSTWCSSWLMEFEGVVAQDYEMWQHRGGESLIHRRFTVDR